MADDKKPTEWRDRVKSPSEINERMIGGKNSLPSKEGKVDLEKIADNPPENSRKSQPFDKEAWQKNVDEGQGHQSKKAAPDVKQPSSKTGLGKEPAKQVVDKIDELVEGAGQGLKKAVPYLDDIVRGLGSRAAGIAGVFYPESTATDEEMRTHELNAQENLQEFPEPPNSEDSLSFSADEKRAIMLTMNSFEEKEPDFLKDLEPDMKMDFDLDTEAPSFSTEDGMDGMDGLDFD